MADAARRIAITNPRSPLARGLLSALRSSPEIEQVRGVVTRSEGRGARAPVASDHPSEADLDFVPLVPDPRPFAAYLKKERIDTVVQCGLAPDRSGDESHAIEADVIAAMCLGAAIAHAGSPVLNWVLASSTAIYPIGSHSPLLQTEGQQRPREDETVAASIEEAEDYARDVAHRLPHLNVAIMRLQHLIGPGVRGPLANLLGHDPAPVLIGFDPAIQLLHLEDAVSALEFAVRDELAGIYNVASSGVIHWNDAVRAAGRSRFPVLPLGVSIFEPLLERLGLPFAPTELLDLLRFGHAVDIRKLERAGWKPRFDQTACLSQATPTGARHDAN